MSSDAEGYRKALLDHLLLIRSLVISYLATLVAAAVVLLVWREPLYAVYRLVSETTGMEIISGGVMAPLTSFISVAVLYATVLWTPIASVIVYRWCTYPEDPVLEPHEKPLFIAYLLAINTVVVLSLPAALYIFYPAFVRFGTMFAELLGSRPVITVDSATTTFVASYMLTVLVASSAIVLDALMRFLPFVRSRVLKTGFRDRAPWYTPLYFLIAIATPGDVIVATLLYFAMLVIGIETVIAIHRRRESNNQIYPHKNTVHRAQHEAVPKSSS